MWKKQQPPKSQISRTELKDYLMSNPFSPVYVVSTDDIIKGRVLFDEEKFVGRNYLKLDDNGVPMEIPIPQENYGTLLAKISEKHLLYTVHGMRLTLDKLDNLSK